MLNAVLVLGSIIVCLTITVGGFIATWKGKMEPLQYQILSLGSIFAAFIAVYFPDIIIIGM